MAKWSWWGFRPTHSPEHGPPSETPATQRPAVGGSGYGAGHAPDGLRPPPASVAQVKDAGQGVELEVPAQTYVPYLDHN